MPSAAVAPQRRAAESEEGVPVLAGSWGGFEGSATTWSASWAPLPSGPEGRGDGIRVGPCAEVEPFAPRPRRLVAKARGYVLQNLEDIKRASSTDSNLAPHCRILGLTNRLPRP